jgi:hypothetical protein
VTATYKPQGIPAPNQKEIYPEIRRRRGCAAHGKVRQITIRLDTKKFRQWLAASAAVDYRDLRNWLIYLADREAEASINPS